MIWAYRRVEPFSDDLEDRWIVPVTVLDLPRLAARTAFQNDPSPSRNIVLPTVLATISLSGGEADRETQAGVQVVRRRCEGAVRVIGLPSTARRQLMLLWTDRGGDDLGQQVIVPLTGQLIHLRLSLDDVRAMLIKTASSKSQIVFRQQYPDLLKHRSESGDRHD